MFLFGGERAPKRLFKPELRVNAVEESDVAFELGDGTFWMESLNILFFGADGSFMHNGFVVASVPMNKHKVMLNTKYFSPEGVEHQFQNTYSVSALRWSGSPRWRLPSSAALDR